VTTAADDPLSSLPWIPGRQPLGQNSPAHLQKCRCISVARTREARRVKTGLEFFPLLLRTAESTQVRSAINHQAHLARFSCCPKGSVIEVACHHCASTISDFCLLEPISEADGHREPVLKAGSTNTTLSPRGHRAGLCSFFLFSSLASINLQKGCESPFWGVCITCI
jgi:hypothetical protein